MVAVQAKCGEGGKLFGAVTSKEIADVLNNKFKVDIDKKRVEIKEPIRQLGEYPVRIKLHQKAVAEVTVKVEEAYISGTSSQEWCPRNTCNAGSLT